MEERLKKIALKFAERIEELEDRILEAMEPCKSKIEEAMNDAVAEVAGARIPVRLRLGGWRGYVHDQLRVDAEYMDREKVIIVYLEGHIGVSSLSMSLAHEVRHAMQHRKLGDRFLEEYNRALAEHGYHDNPFQVDANEWARKNYERLAEALDREASRRCLKLGVFLACTVFDVVQFNDEAFYALHEIIHHEGTEAPDTGRLLARLEEKARKLANGVRHCCQLALEQSKPCREGS